MEYLAEIGDLLVAPSPRMVVGAPRRWMEPYHQLEQIELGKRIQATGQFPEPFRLWLTALVLLNEPFVGRFDWPEGLTDEELEALDTRADLLALAAGASKPALDTLLAGYYWSASGQIRSLLDAGRRVGYLRLAGPPALPYFRAPEESPITADGSLRKELPRLRYETMKDVFHAAGGGDEETFDLLSIGVNHMHWGAHPSGEGLLQIYAGEEPHKVVGPTYIRPFCAFSLKWGLLAHLVLLEELHILRPQGDEWFAEFRRIGQEYSRWQADYNAEFVDLLPGATSGDLEGVDGDSAERT